MYRFNRNVGVDTKLRNERLVTLCLYSPEDTFPVIPAETPFINQRPGYALHSFEDGTVEGSETTLQVSKPRPTVWKELA